MKQWNVILLIVLVLFGVRETHNWCPMSDLIDRLRINTAMSPAPCACVQLCSRNHDYMQFGIPLGKLNALFTNSVGYWKKTSTQCWLYQKVCVVCSYNRRTYYTNPTRTLKRNWLEILSRFFLLGCLGRFREPRSWQGHWWRALCCGSVLWTSRKHGKIFRW